MQCESNRIEIFIKEAAAYEFRNIRYFYRSLVDFDLWRLVCLDLILLLRDYNITKTSPASRIWRVVSGF